MSKKKIKALLSVILILFSTIIYVFFIDQDGQLRFTTINVGQGDALLFELPTGETILIDAGTRSQGKKVASFMRSRGIRSIDILVATHPHEDHIGGMMNILDAFPIGKIWDSPYRSASQTQLRFLETIAKKGIRYGHPKSGFSQQIGDVQITVLSPNTVLKNTNSDANNNSLVLLVSYGGIRFLLMGDAEKEERQGIAKSIPEVTILKMAHHGSITGIDLEFLKKINPELVVISFGERNPYGHPHKETIDLLKKQKIPWYITPEGSIEITTNGKEYSIKQLPH